MDESESEKHDGSESERGQAISELSEHNGGSVEEGLREPARNVESSASSQAPLVHVPQPTPNHDGGGQSQRTTEAEAATTGKFQPLDPPGREETNLVITTKIVTMRGWKEKKRVTYVEDSDVADGNETHHPPPSSPPHPNPQSSSIPSANEEEHF